MFQIFVLHLSWSLFTPHSGDLHSKLLHIWLWKQIIGIKMGGEVKERVVGALRPLTLANFQIVGRGGRQCDGGLQGWRSKTTEVNQWKKKQNRAWALDRLSNHHPSKVCCALTTLCCYDLIKGMSLPVDWELAPWGYLYIVSTLFFSFLRNQVSWTLK